jgi:DNA-damage-inducible protein J
MYYTVFQCKQSGERVMAVSRMVQARVPGEIQDVANRVIQASGLSVSDVVRVLMTRIAQDKAIPAVLFQPNAETLAAIDEARAGGGETVTLDQLRAEIQAAQAE